MEDGGTHVGKREAERETPGGILDQRAPRDGDRTWGERDINNLNPADPREGRRAREGDGKEQDDEGVRRREDRCSRQFRSGVSTCPPFSSTPLIIQI